MKSLRIATLSLLVVLCAAPAHADSIPTGDPVFKTGGDGPSSPTPISSAAFYILSPSGTSPGMGPNGIVGGTPCELFQSFFGVIVGPLTSPDCFFQNVINPAGTGQNITQLVFDIADVSPDNVTCGFLNSLAFTNCTKGSFDDGGTSLTYSGGLGVPFQSDFFVQLQGFPENTQAGCAVGMGCPANAKTSPIPEPGTLALFLGGLGALLVGRKLRARSLS